MAGRCDVDDADEERERVTLTFVITLTGDQGARRPNVQDAPLEIACRITRSVVARRFRSIRDQ
jgi:hypothetical protein